MSIGIILQTPHSLASLPKPFDPKNGKTWTAPVYGYRAQKRRKRPEIAVGVDGEGLSVYDVHNPQLVTSNALSPQTQFLCPLTSIYRRLEGQGARRSSQRLTYAAIRDNTARKTDLVCFARNSTRNSSDSSALSETRLSFQLPDTKDLITAINIVAVDSSTSELAAAFDVIVTYNTGTTVCLGGDLKSKRWETLAENLHLNNKASEGRLEHVSIVDLNTARKGLLRSRQDATAAFDNVPESAQALANVMVMIESRVNAGTQSRRLRVLALPPRSKDDISTSQRGLRQLLAYELPAGSVAASPVEAQYSLHAATGRLNQLLDGGIVTYDLSELLPRVISSVRLSGSGYLSLLQLSTDKVLTCDADQFYVFDTTYSALQATTSAKMDDPLTKGGSKKSKKDKVQPSTTVVAYLAEIGLAVVLQGNSLLGLPINRPLSKINKSRSSSTLLVESLGKGIDERKSQLTTKQEVDSWKARINACVESGDVGGLEEILASDLGIAGQTDIKADVNGTDHVSNGDTTTESEPRKEGEASHTTPWTFPSVSALLAKTETVKALYCLRKLFSRRGSAPPNSTDSGSLFVAFYSANALKWLALTGYLSRTMLQRALADGSFGSTITIKSGDLMTALSDFDPSLGLVHSVLSWPVHLDIHETVQALKLTIHSLQPPSSAEGQKKLAAPEDEDTIMNGDGEVENALAIETAAADDDLDFALAALNDGLMIRSMTLHAVFARLQAFSASSVVEVFRSLLSSQETIFLIQLLRIELATGSWTSRQIDSVQFPTSDDADLGRPSDRAITVISNLLNICVDAIGASGWLTGMLTAEADDMLDMLRAETSAALEGCYEAASLSVYLDDFARYSNRLTEGGHSAVSSSKKRKVDALTNPGFVSSTADDGVVDPILPMGFKVAKIERTRVTKGGMEKTKSKGAVGKEISMRVGAYSFDRIRV